MSKRARHASDTSNCLGKIKLSMFRFVHDVELTLSHSHFARVQHRHIVYTLQAPIRGRSILLLAHFEQVNCGDEATPSLE